MQLRIKRTITSIDLLYFSIYTMILIWCVPMTMCLPSLARQGLQILAFITFVSGMLLHKENLKLLQFVLVVLFVTTFVYGVWQNKKSLSSCAISVISGWMFCCFGIILRKENDSNRKKKLLLFITAIMVVTAITTIIGIQRYPLVVRELGRGARSYSGLTGSDFALAKWEYRITNIAGWNQLYGIAFFTPCLAYLYKMTKRKEWVLFLIICEICVIRSQITFALLLSMFLIVFSFIKPSAERKKLIVLFIFFVIGMVAALNVDVLIMFTVSLCDHAGFSVLSNKLYDLYLVTQGVSSGDALARFNLYRQSIEIYQENKLFGSFSLGNFTFRSFSQHSDFFDMLGFYGITGVGIVVFILLRYTHYLRVFVKEDRWIAIILLAAFIGMYIFNPIWYSPQIFISVFLLPSLFTALKPRQNNYSG